MLDSSKPFDFGDDPNRDPDPGIFTAVGYGQLWEFCETSCLGGGLRSPSASSVLWVLLRNDVDCPMLNATAER